LKKILQSSIFFKNLGDAMSFEKEIHNFPIIKRLRSLDATTSSEEKAAWYVCRLSTIVAAVALGALAGMALPSMIAALGIGILTILTLSLSVQLIKNTDTCTVERKTLRTLASSVFLVAGIALGITGFIWLSSLIGHLASMALTSGVGYLQGKVVPGGTKFVKDQFFKGKVDLLTHIGIFSTVATTTMVAGQRILMMFGGSPLGVVASVGIAVSMISEEILGELRKKNENGRKKVVEITPIEEPSKPT
jgi:hypothetical protein